ncbi:MAG TPA: hypothetical protein VLB84_18250, partial [Bacteroidia bacterium]|nr:hypothetical protein [Bacteroidia bacterium]
MRTLFDVAAVTAVLLLGYLLFLLLFERGALYRTSDAVHGLSDEARLGLLSTLLSTPVQTIDSLQMLREGGGLYEAQLVAIRAARRSIHLEAYIFHPGRVADALLAALCE